MKSLLILIATCGGAALAIQSGFNSQLGRALNQPLAAISISLTIGGLLSGSFWLSPTFRNEINYASAPPYLWISGALFSVIGVGIYFVLIPKIGINTTIAAGLLGQIAFAAIAAHFAWFNLPANPLNLQKVAGIALMFIGVLLINSKT